MTRSEAYEIIARIYGNATIGDDPEWAAEMVEDMIADSAYADYIEGGLYADYIKAVPVFEDRR